MKVQLRGPTFEKNESHSSCIAVGSRGLRIRRGAKRTGRSVYMQQFREVLRIKASYTIKAHLCSVGVCTCSSLEKY